MAKHTPRQYVEMARAAILDLLRQEHAVLWSEAQAKIGDTRWPTVPSRIDPHHLTTARAELITAKRIVSRTEKTRGGLQVSVLHLRDTRGIATAINTAAARKRSLMATFNSWIRPRPGYPIGFVGAAGERVTHESLLLASPHGLRVENPAGGEVATLLGHSVEGGPLDNAAWVMVVNPVGQPVENVLCPIEVKNIRHWIYPPSQELFQLLYKAARLQIVHPDVPVCPVLVTRRKSYLANEMSRELGFRVIDVHRQFVLPIAEVDPDALANIQAELGFTDLVAHDGADPGLTSGLAQVPKTALQNASNWRTFGPELVSHFDELREPLAPTVRQSKMDEFREAVQAVGGEAGW